MASSPIPPCLMLRFFFSIVITLALEVSCEAKHFETLSQSSLNPNSYTPIPDPKNSDNDFVLPHYDALIQDSIDAVSKSSLDFAENGVLSRLINTSYGNLKSATSNCRELLSLASYTLKESIGDPMRKTLATVKIDLCSTLAYMDTCSDVFVEVTEEARNIVTSSLSNSREKVTNILTMLPSVDEEHDHNLGSINGGSGSENAWPPSLMSSEERKLLNMKKRFITNVVVAKDGSGRFKTISEAINAAPKNSKNRFVIHVKKGVYDEHLKIDENKWNIMMYGDGMYETIVTGNLGNSNRHSIYDSPTFAVYGRGFAAINMGFENTAGPTGGQAVALLSASDRSVYYRCRMSGYQDTLFALSSRQFYRECVISGSVDFIFGAASAVFQESIILVRKDGSEGFITAHGRGCPQCPGAYSFQNCRVKAAENLRGAKIFLGRPWRDYARVVFMESSLDGLIVPEGWEGWGKAIPKTAYFGEYRNWGPGSGTNRRAVGVRRSISDKEAYGFTVRNFIGGDRWVPPSGAPYKLDL